MAKKQYDDDDGRQIADMSGVDRSLYTYSTIRKVKKKKNAEDNENKKNPQHKEDMVLTKRETRAMMFHAMWSSLLIGLVFVVLAAIFLLFAVFIWFR